MKAEINCYNADTQLQTLNFKVIFRVLPKLKNQLSAKLENEILTIRYSPDFDFQQANNQAVIKNIVKKFITDDAKKYLPQRLTHIADNHGFEFNEVKINSAKSRWGSCNSKRNINLSCYLMLLPLQLIDYVLAHELCHTRQMNHSPKFYDELNKIFPNFSELKQEINKISRKLRGFY
jgi:predicted metal-dependent hydrolase